MQKPSEDQLAQNAEIVKKLVENIGNHDPDLRDCFNNIMKVFGDEFYVAPASSRTEFHACFPGGLCDHSLRVVKFLRKISEALAPGKYPQYKLDFVALVHDLGKIGMPGQPLYVLNDSDWHIKNGMLYKENTELVYMPICDRTMYLLQAYGECPISQEEYIAIRIHDGPLEKCNEKYGMKEPDLAVLLHMADRWACQIEKK